MSLGSDVLSQLPFLRSQALSLMVDYATVSRPGGAPVFDPVTGLLTPSASTVIYEGVCRLMTPQRAQAGTVLFGEQQVTESRYMACFPIDCTDLRIGDLIAFDESADPDVLERSFRITEVPASTFTIYKGFPCEATETP